MGILYNLCIDVLIMHRKDDLRQVISEWFLQELPDTIERDISIPLDTSIIVSIIGPRRAGKTFTMYTIIKKLREHIPMGNILYINFEHEKLRNLDANDLGDMLAIYYEVSKVNRKEKIYLFLDEIHVVSGWSNWVNRISETKEFHIYLSGSSSKLLSRELSTRLRGRSIDFTVFPYSFREFLRVTEVLIQDPNLLIHSEKRGTIMGALEEYIKIGGYPEVVGLKDLGSKLLRSYIDTIIIKDVGERFRIEPSILAAFFDYAISTYSKYFTGSKAYNYLKTLNYRVSREFPLELMEHFTEVFALFQTEIFSFSAKSKKQYPRKIYVADTGIIQTKVRNAEIGRLIENLVFIELCKRSEYFTKFQVYYWKEYGKAAGKEVDFVIMEGSKVLELMNVTYASSGETVPAREISGILLAAKELKCSKKRIITWDYFENGDIEFTPLWKWLLETEMG